MISPIQAQVEPKKERSSSPPKSHGPKGAAPLASPEQICVASCRLPWHTISIPRIWDAKIDASSQHCSISMYNTISIYIIIWFKFLLKLPTHAIAGKQTASKVPGLACVHPFLFVVKALKRSHWTRFMNLVHLKAASDQIGMSNLISPEFKIYMRSLFETIWNHFCWEKMKTWKHGGKKRIYKWWIVHSHVKHLRPRDASKLPTSQISL